MSSIDDRIVEMRFNNQQFEKGIKQSTDSLESLRNSLKLDGATKGLEDVEKASRGFSLANIADAVSSISDRFNALGAIGFTVLQNLTNSVLNFGKKLVANLLEPLFGGGQKRALNMEQAMFQFEGLGMNVEATMQSALDAVKGTAFGLDAAAIAASQFGATGMQAGDEMTSALRGIAGVAAMAGSSYEDIAQIFTTVAGNGRVMGDTLLRLSSRGINAAAIMGKAMGKTEADIRAMVTKGEIDFQTFSDIMSEAFGEHATKANETYTGSLSNMNAALSRIGASVATPKLKAMRDIFNALTPVIDELHDALGPMISRLESFMNRSSKKIVSFLGNIDLSGLARSMAPLSNALKSFVDGVLNIVDPIRKAFLEMFPPLSADALVDIAYTLQDLARRFADATKDGSKLHRIFSGIFAVLSIGWEILKGVASVFGRLFGVVFEGSGGFLELAARVGDFLVKVRNAIVEGNGLAKVFEFIGNALSAPIAFFQGLIGTLVDLTSGFSNSTLSMDGFVESVKKRFGPLGSIFEGLLSIFGGIGDALKAAWTSMQPYLETIGEWLGQLGQNISKATKNADWSLLFDGLNTGLLAGGVIMIKKLFGTLTDGLSDLTGGGILDSVKEIFAGVTGQLEAMQQRVKADILIKIAIALGIIAAALFVLALIDSEQLAGALASLMTVMLGLISAMYALDKISVSSPAKLASLGAAMILMSIAVLILSSAIAKLGKLKPEELLTGLLGVIGAMGILVLAADQMEKSAANLVKAGFGIGVISIALLILASAVKKFGEMDISTIGKGIGAIGALLLVMVGFQKLQGNLSGIVKTAIGLAILGGALNIMANVMAKFAGMSLEQIGVGIAAIAGSLVVIAGAMHLMPKSMMKTAVSLVVVASALLILSNALNSMGGMSWDEIGRSLVVLAGSLGILAIAMNLMTGTLAGAAALVVVSFALSMLVPLLVTLGSMSWAEIGTGLGALALVLGILAAAGMLLTPAMPTLLLLGAAILLIGLGAMAAGVGVMAFALGLTALAAAGAAGAGALALMITTFANLIPLLMQKVGEGLVALAQTVAKSSKAIVEAIITVLLDLLQGMADLIGPAVEIILELIVALLNALADHVPDMVDAGLRLLTGILNGIADNIGNVIDAAVRVATEFMDGIARNLPKIIQSGADLLISFLEGIANGIRQNSARIQAAGLDIASAMLEGIVGGLQSGIGWIVDTARNLAGSALDAVKNFLGIASPSKEFTKVGEWSAEGIVVGLKNMNSAVGDAGAGVGRTALDNLRDALDTIPDILDEDLEPIVITPVLDLSEVENGFNAFNPDTPTFGAELTNNLADQAQDVMETDNNVDRGREESEKEPAMVFNQYNNSPKSLDSIDIYRNTKNQLAAAREELKKR